MGADADPVYKTQNGQIKRHETICFEITVKETRQKSFDDLPGLVRDKGSDLSLCRTSIVELRVVLVDK